MNIIYLAHLYINTQVCRPDPQTDLLDPSPKTGLEPIQGSEYIKYPYKTPLNLQILSMYIYTNTKNKLSIAERQCPDPNTPKNTKMTKTL
jgi:hypothetical protein